MLSLCLLYVSICHSDRTLGLSLCECIFSKPPGGITEFDYKISLRSSIVIGLEVNYCIYKLNIPKILRI